MTAQRHVKAILNLTDFALCIFHFALVPGSSAKCKVENAKCKVKSVLLNVGETRQLSENPSLLPQGGEAGRRPDEGVSAA